jgi:ubiquinone biosynthesis protein UbiJ|tara:strand:- start:768 stop:1016 length:249 start_codon:yes stop_codon:yes gene_type:complete
MTDLRRMTREFLLDERQAPSLASYLQSIAEVLDSVTSRSQRDRHKIEMAKSNLSEVRRHTRRLEERVNVLEEQIQVLEESKE